MVNAMEINWWFRYEGDDNWCPDCGEMRGICICGPLCGECGGTMELKLSYEDEAQVVVHRYWCAACCALRDVV